MLDSFGNNFWHSGRHFKGCLYSADMIKHEEFFTDSLDSLFTAMLILEALEESSTVLKEGQPDATC